MSNELLKGSRSHQNSSHYPERIRKTVPNAYFALCSTHSSKFDHLKYIPSSVTLAKKANPNHFCRPFTSF